MTAKAITKADRMKRQTKRKYKMGHLEVGCVVQVGIPEVDRGKVDFHNLTLVVVNIEKKHTDQMYRLASRHGVFAKLCCRTDLNPLLNADPVLFVVDFILKNWKTMKIMTLAKLVQEDLVTERGQGMARCSCKGECKPQKCSCFKAGRQCTSKCHVRSTTCTNHD
jgi:hypothetical protein